MSHTSTYDAMKGENMQLHTLPPQMGHTSWETSPQYKLIDLKNNTEHLPHRENNTLKNMKETIHSLGCFPLSTLSPQN